MRIELDGCAARSLTAEDAPSLARHANNRAIWLNLRDAFPHPYSLSDAEQFIAAAGSQDPQTVFAIDVDGAAVGAIGFRVGSDVERVSAEIGYWLGQAYWNRGIMTQVLRAVVLYAIHTFALTRVHARPFEWNTASARVLEKAGFVLEGRMRKSAIKDGKVTDQLLYGFVQSESDGPPS